MAAVVLPVTALYVFAAMVAVAAELQIAGNLETKEERAELQAEVTAVILFVTIQLRGVPQVLLELEVVEAQAIKLRFAITEVVYRFLVAEVEEQVAPVLLIRQIPEIPAT